MYGLGLIKGLKVTMKNMLLPSRMFTVHQYPDRKIGVFGLAKLAEKNALSYAFSEPMMAFKAMLGLATVEDRLPQHPRFRGEEFSFYLDRCTGCASCAKYCPLGIIRIVTHPSEEQMPEGDRYAIDVFDIDIGRCMFCGLCVEACPYDALHMGSGFEEGTYSRRDLVIDVDKLESAPKHPSTWYRPQMEGRRYDPRSDEELAGKEAGRHERPSLHDQEERWGRR